jgi:hypothetical protein
MDGWMVCYFILLNIYCICHLLLLVDIFFNYEQFIIIVIYPGFSRIQCVYQLQCFELLNINLSSSSTFSPVTFFLLHHIFVSLSRNFNISFFGLLVSHQDAPRLSPSAVPTPWNSLLTNRTF